MSDTHLKVVAIGGYLEYGRNCTVLVYQDKGLVLDFGVNVAELQKNKPSRKLLVPQLGCRHLKGISLVGCLISHAHLDHIGGIPYEYARLNCPIYASDYTVQVCKSLRYPGQYVPVSAGEVFEIGPFKVKALDIQHSIPQALFYRVSVGNTTVCYASDFKLDFKPVIGEPTNLQTLAQQLRDLDLLIFDTTRARVSQFTKSEMHVASLAEEYIANARMEQKHIIYTSFASHVGRLKTVVNLAERYGYPVYVLGKTFKHHVEAARNSGVFALPQRVKLVNRMYDKFFKKQFDTPCLFVMSGGNGQSNAVLSRVIEGSIPTSPSFLDRAIVLLGGSQIPASKWQRQKLISAIRMKGLTLYDEVHASGHASITDIANLIKAVKPFALLPTHSSHETIGRFCDFFRERYPQYALDRNLICLQNGQYRVIKGRTLKPDRELKSQDG